MTYQPVREVGVRVDQGEITRRLQAAGEVRRAAGMWVVWRAPRSRGVNRPKAAVLCAGKVLAKAGDSLLTVERDRVRVFEAWVLPASYPLQELWPRDEGKGFRALEMKEAQRVLGEIISRGEKLG